MKQNFTYALSLVLKHEGDFVNHSRDPGGPTMKGITLRTFRQHFGTKKTITDLKNITQEQLEIVYKDGYWDKCKCDDLPAGVDYAVFDAAVNSGPGRAARWLQAAVGIVPDGEIGAMTLERVSRYDPIIVINTLCSNRLRFLKSLTTYKVFGRGWSHRVEDVRGRALALASRSA